MQHEVDLEALSSSQIPIEYPSSDCLLHGSTGSEVSKAGAHLRLQMLNVITPNTSTPSIGMTVIPPTTLRPYVQTAGTFVSSSGYLTELCISYMLQSSIVQGMVLARRDGQIT